MASDFSPVISFNVGGQISTTLRETLLKDANSRLALIARGLLGTARDPVTGAFVVDRDPTYFQIILNFLRDGWCRLPKTAEERKELLQEVRYYQLTGLEGWLRTQELLAETGAPQAQELLVPESPRLRVQSAAPHQLQSSPPFNGGPSGPYMYTGQRPGHLAYPSPSSAPPMPMPGPGSPRAAVSPIGTQLATGRGPPTLSWGSPSAARAVPSSTATLVPNTLTGSAPAVPLQQPQPQPPQGYAYPGTYLTSQTHGPTAPQQPLNATLYQPAFPSHNQHPYVPQPHPQPQQPQQGAQQTAAYGSPTRISPTATNGGTAAGGGGGGGRPAWTGAGGAEGAIASLREAFLAATSPQRPVPHVGPYSLASAADESSSWTSKYLKGNDILRELVNTLLELAFLAPHRVLHSGKSHVSISAACTHGQEGSLVGSKEDLLRNNLLEVRVSGALGWTFEMTLRPGSDVALWDKYGGVAAAVQDNWFVLGAILKDQFGVVLEEDTAARPACVACRRTCLAITLNKIY